jgi:hypothetical protein
MFEHIMLYLGLAHPLQNGTVGIDLRNCMAQNTRQCPGVWYPGQAGANGDAHANRCSGASVSLQNGRHKRASSASAGINVFNDFNFIGSLVAF